MKSMKEIYTEITSKWLKNYLEKHYSKDYKIEVLIPKSNLSKMNHESIKKILNYSLLDFSPDVLGILTSKKNQEVSLVLLNRNLNPISVKEIGEMNIYSTILNPKLAFIVSLKGLPTEVNSILLNDHTCSSLLNYHDKNIIVLKIDENGETDDKATFPRRFKNAF
jgi:predicted DNA-binding protein YlxM (UPF0122 family)